MKVSDLEDLDVLHEYRSGIQGEWIKRIPDRDLYEIAIWLLHHLGPNRYQSNHVRTAMRSICQIYYQSQSWTDKQKFYLGYGVISLWNERQIDKDPRYATDTTY
jgi:hypothetical protein